MISETRMKGARANNGCNPGATYMFPDGHINIGSLCNRSRALGPGERFVIWTQGCLRDCPSCGSPEWREMKDATLLTPGQLAQKVLAVPNLEGITISGGEPMLQAKPLLEMLNLVHAEKPLSVICYTGYTLEELTALGDDHANAFLRKIDVLIDGPYQDYLNDNKGLRGSTNQRIHFLTNIYKPYEKYFLNKTRDIEVHVREDHLLIVGIKYKGTSGFAFSRAGCSDVLEGRSIFGT